MKKALLAAAMIASVLIPAEATRYPILGGPGLVHVQSAKVSPGFGFRSINAITSRNAKDLNNGDTTGNSYIDIWSHNAVAYSPMKGLGLMINGLGHGEKWSYSNSSSGDDATLGCPGDVAVSAKYCLNLQGGKIDLALMPTVTIPMGNQGTAADGEPLVDDPASQTGKVDFGAKALADFNMGRTTLYANIGMLTRGNERIQLPLGLAAEYGISSKFSAFLEASGEMRMGTESDSVSRDWYPKGVGYDRNDYRITPGIRYVPFDFLALNLSADIGLSDVAAPWQVILGIDFPAAAGRAAQALILGGIAGMIKDRDNQVPMKGMITFPGSDLPGLVSDNMGTYVSQLPPGEYKIHIYANGYRWLERRIKVEPGKTIKWDLTLKRKLGTIAGKVMDAATGAPLAATLSFAGSSIPPFNTDPATGAFETQVPPGKYRLSAQASGYQSQEFEYTIKDKTEIKQDFALQSLTPAPRPMASTPVPPYPPKTPRGTDKPSSEPKPSPAPAAPKPAAATPAPSPEPKPAAPAKMTAEEIDKLYKAGVRQFMNEEFKKAEATFLQVLKADKNHAKAKDYLSKTRARLKLIK
jgi:hypothetical protein